MTLKKLASDLLANKYKSIGKDKLFYIVFVLGMVWLLFVFVYFPKQAFVEGLLQAYYTQEGLVFYKDFINQYFPFLHFLLNAYHGSVGLSQESSIVLAPLNTFILYLSISVVSFKALDGKYRVLPLLFFLIWDPILAENHFNPNPFQATVNFLAFALWFYWFRKPTAKKGFVIGILLSASFLTVHIVAFFVGIVFLSGLYLVKRNKKNLNSFLGLCYGLAIPVVFTIVYFIHKDALHELYYRNIEYYFRDYPFTGFGKGTENIVIFLAIVSPVILLLRTLWLYIVSKVHKKFFTGLNVNLPFLLFLILITASLPLAIWLAIFHPIRFYLMMPIFAFVFGLGVYWNNVAGKAKDRVSLILVILIASLNLFVFAKYLVPKYERNFRYPKDRLVLSRAYPHDPMYWTVQWVREYTEKDARLFVIDDPLYYLDTERLPSHARATHNEPYTYLPLDTLLDEIREKPPDYWVIDERLIVERFPDFGYEYVGDFFESVYGCDEVVYQNEYLTVRKHAKGKPVCI